MIRILVTYPGDGKTYKLKSEIVHKYYGNGVSSKEIYVIEPQEYNEYSDVFNRDFVHVFKPSDDISFLQEKRDCDIYVDCECRDNDFMRQIATIAKKARINNNNLTITFLEIWDDLSDYEKHIFDNANEVLIGKCTKLSEYRFEKLFSTRLRPLESDFDFRIF